MSKRDMKSNLDAAQSIVPAVQTGSVNGSGVDLRGYDGALVIINSGAVAGAGNVTPKLQESDDNITFTDVAAGDMVGAFTNPIAQNSIDRVSYIGTKRYIRVVGTLNSGTSVAYGATVVRGLPTVKPLA